MSTNEHELIEECRNEIKILNAFKKDLKIQYKEMKDRVLNNNLDPANKFRVSDIPETTSQAECCARIASDYYLDGSIFRNEIPKAETSYNQFFRKFRKMINYVPEVIAAIETYMNSLRRKRKKRRSNQTIATLNIKQLAKRLNLSVSTVRNRENRGEIPQIVGERRSKLLWSKSEIIAWIKAGQPVREKWEAIKGELNV